MFPTSKRRGLILLVCLLLTACQQNNKQNVQHPALSPWWESAKNTEPLLPELPEHPTIKPTTHFAAAQLFEEQGNMEGAIGQYEKAIALDSKFLIAYNRLGICLDKLRRHQEAEAIFRQALKIDADSAYVLNNLAFNLMMQQRYQAAEQYLRRALAIQPGYRRAQTNLGIVLAKTQRPAEALVQFAAALGESQAWYNIGLLYKAEEQYDQAQAAFEKCVALDPKMLYARIQLKKLRERPELGPAMNAPADEALDRTDVRANEPVVARSSASPSTSVAVRERPVVSAPAVDTVDITQPFKPPAVATIGQDMDDGSAGRLVIEAVPCEVHDMNTTLAELQADMRRCSSGNYADLYLMAGQSSVLEDGMAMDPELMAMVTKLTTDIGKGVFAAATSAVQHIQSNRELIAHTVGQFDSGALAGSIKSGVQDVIERYSEYTAASARHAQSSESEAAPAPSSMDVSYQPFGPIVTLEDIEAYLLTISGEATTDPRTAASHQPDSH